jgi:hypothetical protein
MHAPSQIAHAPDTHREVRRTGKRERGIQLAKPNRIGVDEYAVRAIDARALDLLRSEAPP